MRHRPTPFARLTALALFASFGTAVPAAETPLTLDQAMAHPDWIGPPVESAWWALDGQNAYFTLKRADSPVRDTWRQPVAGGLAAVVEGAELANLDAAQPVFDASRQRAVFVRNGDVFLRLWHAAHPAV